MPLILVVQPSDISVLMSTSNDAGSATTAEQCEVNIRYPTHRLLDCLQTGPFTNLCMELTAVCSGEPPSGRDNVEFRKDW